MSQKMCKSRRDVQRELEKTFSQRKTDENVKDIAGVLLQTQPNQSLGARNAKVYAVAILLIAYQKNGDRTQYDDIVNIIGLPDSYIDKYDDPDRRFKNHVLKVKKKIVRRAGIEEALPDSPKSFFTDISTELEKIDPNCESGKIISKSNELFDYLDENVPYVFSGFSPRVASASIIWISVKLIEDSPTQKQIAKAANTSTVSLRSAVDSIVNGIYDSDITFENFAPDNVPANAQLQNKYNNADKLKRNIKEFDYFTEGETDGLEKAEKIQHTKKAHKEIESDARRLISENDILDFEERDDITTSIWLSARKNGYTPTVEDFQGSYQSGDNPLSYALQVIGEMPREERDSYPIEQLTLAGGQKNWD